MINSFFFFFSSRRRHTRFDCDWSSDVCSSDLDDGVTLNTPGGPHIGPNQFQNFPVISKAMASGAGTSVLLRLNSAPNSSFIVQIFANTTPDPTGHGQGKTLVAT